MSNRLASESVQAEFIQLWEVGFFLKVVDFAFVVILIKCRNLHSLQLKCTLPHDSCTRKKTTLPGFDLKQHLAHHIRHSRLRADPRSSDPGAHAFVLGTDTLVRACSAYFGSSVWRLIGRRSGPMSKWRRASISKLGIHTS